MAKQLVGAIEKPGPFVRVRDFFQEVKIEMAKVAWPSRDELKQSTTVVMLVLLIFAAIVFFYDNVFNFVIINLLRLFG